MELKKVEGNKYVAKGRRNNSKSMISTIFSYKLKVKDVLSQTQNLFKVYLNFLLINKCMCLI